MIPKSKRDELRAQIEQDIARFKALGKEIEVIGQTKSRDAELWENGIASRREKAAKAGKANARKAKKAKAVS